MTTAMRPQHLAFSKGLLRRTPALRTFSSFSCHRNASPAQDQELGRISEHAGDALPDDIRRVITYAEHARTNNYQIPLLSKASPGLDTAKAYHALAATRALREVVSGDVVVGRKVSLGESAGAAAHGATSTFWSYLYKTSVTEMPEPSASSDAKTVVANLRHLSALEPRLKPEIVLGIAKPFTSDMDDSELLDCVEWIAPGLEIATSIFPGWRFTTVDATIASGLHGLLLLGKKAQVQDLIKSAGSSQNFLSALKTIRSDFTKNGKLITQSSGAQATDSPIAALRSLAEMLETDDHNSPVKAGEMVTIGALAEAAATRHGDTWSSKLSELDFPGMSVKVHLR